eukprot:8213130-Pyramimonas_sp.AAC.1
MGARDKTVSSRVNWNHVSRHTPRVDPLKELSKNMPLEGVTSPVTARKWPISQGGCGNNKLSTRFGYEIRFTRGYP